MNKNLPTPFILLHETDSRAWLLAASIYFYLSLSRALNCLLCS